MKTNKQDTILPVHQEFLQNDVESIEKAIGYKLNKEKSAWVHSQLHLLDRDIDLRTLQMRMKLLIKIALKEMVNEKDENERARISQLINTQQQLVDWFDDFKDFNIISYS